MRGRHLNRRGTRLIQKHQVGFTQNGDESSQFLGVRNKGVLDQSKNGSFQNLLHKTQKLGMDASRDLSIGNRSSVSIISKAESKSKANNYPVVSISKSKTKRVNLQHTMTFEGNPLQEILEEKSKRNNTILGSGSVGHFIETNKSISDIAGSAYNDESINLPYPMPKTTKHKN